MSCRLSYLIRNEPSRRVYTIQVLKEQYVTLAAVNFIFTQDKLSVIEFNSYRLGITNFSIADRKFYGNVWETESDAKAISNLNYHYTSIGLAEAANNDSNVKIYELVLKIIDDSALTEIVEKAFSLFEISDSEIADYINKNFG